MIAALLALSLSAQAQITAASRTLLVAVVDRNKHALVDLEADDFVLRESGQLREIFGLCTADYPVAVIVDTSAGSSRDAEAIRRAAARFITRVGQRPIAVEALGNPPRAIASFTDDRATVLKRLEGLVIDTSPDIPFLQAIADAARAIREAGQPFSAIVVISSTPPPPIAAADGQLRQILDTGATIHVVANRAGVAPSAIDQLRGLSEQTHGQFTAIYSRDSYGIALDHLADQMASEMMIEYFVPPDAPPSSDATVGVRVPGAVVRGLGVR